MRMNEIAETQLQQYLDEDKGTYARRLCEIARRRHTQVMEDYPEADDVQAAWERVDEACGTTVAEMMLATFLERARNAGEDQRDMTCAAGSNALAFAHTHRRDTERNVQLRTDIFAQCPQLETEWNYVEQGGLPDGTGGPAPDGIPNIPGMPGPDTLPGPPRKAPPQDGAPTGGGEAPPDGTPPVDSEAPADGTGAEADTP